MENSRQKSHCMDNKFVPAIADSLKALDRKIHYKLYMIWAKDGFIDETGTKHKAENTNQSYLSSVMGVSRAQFQKYIRENNPNQPGIYELFKLSKELNIPLEYFVDDTIDYTPNPSKISPTQTQRIASNQKLCTRLSSEYMKADSKVKDAEWENFIKKSGLTKKLLYCLKPEAMERLSETIKQAVDDTLSDKNNTQTPINPIDVDDFE